MRIKVPICCARFFGRGGRNAYRVLVIALMAAVVLSVTTLSLNVAQAGEQASSAFRAGATLHSDVRRG